MTEPLSTTSTATTFRRRRGFSFVEVLFAVMILGIGFIMLAGIFPVALQQAADTQDETIGAAIARGAVGTFEGYPSLSASGIFTGKEGKVVRLQGVPWDVMKGNQILPEDTRYGWVAMLKRDPNDYRGQPPAFAQVIVVPVFVRRENAVGPSPGFNPVDLEASGTGDAAVGTLMPLRVRVRLVDGGSGPDTCTLESGPGVGAAAPGAVVVLAEGVDGASPARPAAGRAFRLGNLNGTATNVYQLLPGNDLATPQDQPTASVDAWIVGRAMSNPGAATPQFTGPSMAIGVYSTYISLR